MLITARRDGVTDGVTDGDDRISTRRGSSGIKRGS